MEYNLRPHRKSAGPVRPKVHTPEVLVHQKVEEVRQGAARRLHYLCSNPLCAEPIRKDKWETHVLTATRRFRLLCAAGVPVLHGCLFPLHLSSPGASKLKYSSEAISDAHLQEDPASVLERQANKRGIYTATSRSAELKSSDTHFRLWDPNLILYTSSATRQS